MAPSDARAEISLHNVHLSPELPLRIRSLQGDISSLQMRQDAAQVTLNAKQSAGSLFPFTSGEQIDPITGRVATGNGYVRDPFPGNIIPPDRINPLAAQILAFYPLPNTTTAGVPPWQSNLANLAHINRD